VLAGRRQLSLTDDEPLTGHEPLTGGDGTARWPEAP
jgi:hypothetical protein